jgi:mediator of RNA polymerase II transcription subunit 12, fungi type
MPGRVTLNDSKRQAWFADLANPEVPLQKLGKSVPHGAKGQDLLDLLHTNNVAIPRAVWFLRVFGANETVSLGIFIPVFSKRLIGDDSDGTP